LSTHISSVANLQMPVEKRHLPYLKPFNPQSHWL